MRNVHTCIRVIAFSRIGEGAPRVIEREYCTEMKKLDHSDDDGKGRGQSRRIALSFRKKFQCQNAELVPMVSH